MQSLPRGVCDPAYGEQDKQATDEPQPRLATEWASAQARCVKSDSVGMNDSGRERCGTEPPYTR